MIAPYSAADYAAAARSLMPRGRVWPTDADSVQAQVLAGVGTVCAEIDNDAVELLNRSKPSDAVQLLPEWEETLGLPDPCLGPKPTVQQRQDQALARFVGSGGQSASWFKAYARRLGFEIDIRVYAPFRVGARAGSALNGAGYAFTWLVTILSGTVSFSHAAFRAGTSHSGDPLSSSAAGRTMLECELRSLAPAHTRLIFAS